MEQKEKIKYITIALRIGGYNFSTKDTEIIISIYELIIEKKGEADLKDISKAISDAIQRANEPEF